MTARFEVVRGDDGWWGRQIAANGRTTWVTETMQRRAAVLNAIVSSAKTFGVIAPEVVENVPDHEWILRSALAGNTTNTALGVSVRIVDERTKP